MIARTSPGLLEKHAGPISPGDSIVVEPGDAAVLMKWGTLQRVLGAGRHAAAEPELELYFVAETPRTFRAGGETGQHTDQRTGIAVTTRAMMEYALRVTDPWKLISQLGVADEDPVRQWMKSQVLGSMRAVLAEQTSLVMAVANASGLAGKVIAHINPTLADVGLEVTSIDTLVITIPEEDLARLRG
jgi:membrane protease subunit (stomatin/prohibitin family)